MILPLRAQKGAKVFLVGEECQRIDLTTEGTKGTEVFLLMHLNEVSRQVVDAGMKVHTALGPGLLEGAYSACLAYELATRGLVVQVQVPVPVMYGAVRLDIGYRIDLLVGNAVVVELKAVSKLLPVHDAQLLSYLKLGGYKLGLLMNFHELHLKDGIRRIAN